MLKRWYVFVFIITVLTVFVGSHSFLTKSGGNSSPNQVVTLRVGTVNNPDMEILQELAGKYYNKNIEINWIVQEENTLRQDISAELGSNNDGYRENQGYDIITIGSYEVPFLIGSYEASYQINEEKIPLKFFDNLPESYDVEDILIPIRERLSKGRHFYALPFYGESSMTYYRKDLFEQAKIKMPEQPTWEDIQKNAMELEVWAQNSPDKLTNSAGKKVYGVCLRGRPGWGENMALVSMLVSTFGGEWFGENSKATIYTEEWQKAVEFYIELLRRYGPPAAASKGFKQNLELFAEGRCAQWMDATVAAGFLEDEKQSQVAKKVGYAPTPVNEKLGGANWLWSWNFAVPKTAKNPKEAEDFIIWATSKDYINLVGKEKGWIRVPPGTRESTYRNINYEAVAGSFSKMVLNSIKKIRPHNSVRNQQSYAGIQYVDVPEFQSFGTKIGREIADALTGRISVELALKNSQDVTDRAVQRK